MNDEDGGGGLPTAAYKVTAEREHLDSDIEVVMKNRPKNHREDIDQVDELVRLSDARKKIAEERSRKFDEGFFEGRESQREDVKALIQDKIDRLGIENPHSNWRKEELKELLEELEQ